MSFRRKTEARDMELVSTTWPVGQAVKTAASHAANGSSILPRVTIKRVLSAKTDEHIVGVYDSEGPPVPIPNTAVKLTSADNTCMATCREDKSTPTQSEAVFPASLFLFLLINIKLPHEFSILRQLYFKLL